MTKEERNSAIVDVLRKIMWIPDRVYAVCHRKGVPDFKNKSGDYAMLFGLVLGGFMTLVVLKVLWVVLFGGGM